MAGINRNIDELGRVVIPKEMRRSLKLKPGDSIDISVVNDKITLKKNNLFFDIDSFLNILLLNIGKSICKDIICCNNGIIVAQYNKETTRKIGSDISEELLEKIDTGEKTFFYSGSIVDDANEIFTGNILTEPIVPNGAPAGCIMLLSQNSFSKEDEEILKVLSRTLTEYIED